MMWNAPGTMASMVAGLPGRRSSRVPVLDNQPLGDQPGDQVGDGHAGEAGAAGDVSTADLALGVQRLEHERAVVAAGVLRQHLDPRTKRCRRERGPCRLPPRGVYSGPHVC